MSKTYEFNELEALQLGQAIQGALREQSPLKLTISRCAKALESFIGQYSEKKQLLMETIVVKDKDGEFCSIEGLEGDPVTITDYQLSVSETGAVDAFRAISEDKLSIELPIISGEAKVLVGDEKITLEEFLDMDPDASGSLAYVYLTLAD